MLTGRFAIAVDFHVDVSPVFPTKREMLACHASQRNWLMRQHGIDEAAIDVVWDAIALHTTPGIPQHKKPEVALVTAGVEMDVLGLGYLDVPDVHREAVVNAHPRGDHFKEQIIHAFHDGFCHKPETTFGTVNDDVLALLDPKFKRANFCSIILNSAWRE